MVASGNKSTMTRYQQRKQETCLLRTLDNLPMRYDSDDSRSLASSYRTIRSAQMDDAKWATLVSRNQHSESKKLFDDCLNKQGSREDQPHRDSARSSRRSEVTHRSTSVHTGPTRYGSPLYWHNQQEVTRQCRTPSEPPPKYFRAKSPIEDALKRSNSTYHVTRRSSSRPCVPKNPSSYPRFDLVPNSSEISRKLNNNSASHEERQSITPVHIMSRRPYVKMKISSLYPEPTVTMPDCMPEIKVDPVEGGDKEEQVAGDKGSTISHTILGPSNIKVRDTKDKHQPKGPSQLAVNVGCSKASSAKSSSSTRGKRDTGTNTMMGDKVSTKSKSTRRKGSKKASQTSSENAGVPVNGLPTYICPSSEEKSREARIRHWLCDSTFSCADRHVPLVF